MREIVVKNLVRTIIVYDIAKINEVILLWLNFLIFGISFLLS